jgi:hypothetical protein
MKKKLLKILPAFIVGPTPEFAKEVIETGGSGNKKTFQDIVLGVVSELSGLFITLVVALSILIFFWGVTKYIWKGDSKEERKKGKTLMVWGIIAFFVLFSVWGIVKILGDTFFGGLNGIPQF